MAVWLYQFPSGLLIGFAVAAALLVCLAAPWSTHRLLRLAANAERSSAAMDAFKMIGPLTGIFAAFLLLQSVNRLNDARRLVETQAMNLLQLDRALGRVESQEAVQARLAVRDYARVLVDVGWPAMRVAEPAPQVEASLNALSSRVDALARAMSGDRRPLELISADLEAVGDVQSQIVAAAAGSLPQTFWLVLGLLLVLMIVEMAMIEPRLRVILPLAGYFAAIGLLFVMDRPFLGDQSVDPAAIERTITTLDLRARMMVPSGQGAEPDGKGALR